MRLLGGELFLFPWTFSDKIGVNGEVAFVALLGNFAVCDSGGNGAIVCGLLCVRAIRITALGEIRLKLGEAVRQIFDGIEVKFDEIQHGKSGGIRDIGFV